MYCTICLRNLTENETKDEHTGIHKTILEQRLVSTVLQGAHSKDPLVRALSLDALDYQKRVEDMFT